MMLCSWSCPQITLTSSRSSASAAIYVLKIKNKSMTLHTNEHCCYGYCSSESQQGQTGFIGLDVGWSVGRVRSGVIVSWQQLPRGQEATVLFTRRERTIVKNKMTSLGTVTLLRLHLTNSFPDHSWPQESRQKQLSYSLLACANKAALQVRRSMKYVQPDRSNL